MLAAAHQDGWNQALRKFGLAQPSLGSVGISTPVKAPGLPSPGKVPSSPASSAGTTSIGGSPSTSIGLSAAKVGSGTPVEAGAVRGEPADGDRRARSTIDQVFARNENSLTPSVLP